MIKCGLLKGCKLFIDYLLMIVFTIIGLLIFAWLMGSQTGQVVFSAVFTLILFGMIYSRTWNTAARDIKSYTDDTPYWYKGLVMCIPLLALNLLIIAVYALIYTNVIPIRDLVVGTTYVFPEGQPRELVETRLISVLVPIVRLWFGNLVGFLPAEDTNPLLLLAGQLVIPVAAFLGYFAGSKEFYLSALLLRSSKKVKEKFNE